MNKNNFEVFTPGVNIPNVVYDDNINTRKQIYFPICLLRGFESDYIICCKKILKYCHDVLSNKHNPKTATKILNCKLDFNIKYDVEFRSPITHASLEFVKMVANGMELEQKDMYVFLLSCALFSISRDNFFLTNWQMVAARVCGYRSPDNKREMTEFQRRLLKGSRPYKNKLMQEIKNSFGIGYYSGLGVHGFYIYKKMTDKEFMSIVYPAVKEHKKKERDKAKVKDKQSNLTDANISGILESYLKPSGIEVNKQILEYVKQLGINLNNREEVVQAVIKFLG